MNEKWSQTNGFTGRLYHMQLLDVVQMVCLDQASRVIEVNGGGTSGRIVVRSGQIIHAESGGQSGEHALHQMLQWPDGILSLLPSQEDGVNTISKNWELLLMESFRQCLLKSASTSNVSACDTSKGFSAEISNEPLPELIYLACMSQGGCCLELRSDVITGRIWLKDGSIIHAEVGDLQGERAFYEIFRMDSGSFMSLPYGGDGPETIDRQLEHLLIDAIRARNEKTGGPEEGSEQAESLLRKVQRMKVQEKVKLAMSGNKESRTLLMRDNSRLVQIAIINNPMITEGEVALIACLRTVDEEVLKRIAENREWLKSYQIRLALVNNPKTPAGTSTKLVRTLRVQDIRQLSRSRTVSSAVALTARKIMTEKG
jgi:hypothetical protein